MEIVCTVSSTNKVVAIRFYRAGRVYYFDPQDAKLEVNDYVVVETSSGLELGRVVIAPKQVVATEFKQPLKPVLRKATPEDLKLREELKKREEEALFKCRELAAKFDLPIKPLGAEWNLDGSHLTIFFSAEGRVDFRSLVRELVAALKTRVELHQIGPRDASKIIGGLGRCGRPLCCATFLTEFNPLSIKMAKEQNLPLDPTKICGICGCLICCLGYENELYRLARDKLPPLGQQVITSSGPAVVIGLNLLQEKVTLQLEDQAIIELPLTEIIKGESTRR
jgi:cell fate regulator YaaT (PSP1 superfamily)